ncbi:MAG: NADH-quinone oxidoreductase subunit C [bacterium]
MTNQEITKIIKDKFKKDILKVETEPDLTIYVSNDKILQICQFLHDNEELNFVYLSDICGVDYPERSPRFDVVYHLYSIEKNHRIRIKTAVGDGETISSVTGIWQGANWFEREVYDLLGVEFDNHPDLRRILMPDDWQGHPLRKDYPLEAIK